MNSYNEYLDVTTNVYMGYNSALQTNVNVVDGKFIQALNENTLHGVGSSNQRIIDVKKTK